MCAQERIVDIGEHTVEIWSERNKERKFVLWNGPMGIYEKVIHKEPTRWQRRYATSSCQAIIGGGDTIAADNETCL